LRHYASSRKFAGSIPDEVIGFFRLNYSFQPHYGPGVDSASNRNEYQESSRVVNGGRRVRLTTSPPSVSLENVGTSYNHMGLHLESRDTWSVYRLTTGWTTERSEFESRDGQGFSLLHVVHQTGSGVHPTSYPMGTGAMSPEVKQPGRVADHSPPASAEVKKICI
jgi:hypothetical protein